MLTYQNHMFMPSPTERYPEYWLTPGVVSQMPEFLTNDNLDFVALCSKTLYLTPSCSSRYRLLAVLGEIGLAIVDAARNVPTASSSIHHIAKDRAFTHRESS